MGEDEFQKFNDTALDELDRKNNELRGKFGIGTTSRWHFDQATQLIQFFDRADRLVVEAEALPIGSHATQSNSWKWAWANGSMLDDVRARSKSLTDLAATTGFDLFALDRSFHIPGEDMAWMLTAVAVRHLGALGSYRASSKGNSLHTYLALFAVRRVAP